MIFFFNPLWARTVKSWSKFSNFFLWLDKFNLKKNINYLQDNSFIFMQYKQNISNIKDSRSFSEKIELEKRTVKSWAN